MKERTKRTKSTKGTKSTENTKDIKGRKRVRKIKEDLAEERLKKKLKKTTRGWMVDKDIEDDFEV